MTFLNFSEFFKINYSTVLLALLITFTGSFWIDCLYPKALQQDSLSFPEEIPQRAKWRKPFLFISLLFCFGKAWSLTTMPVLLYLLIAVSLLLFMTVTDFEQYVIFDRMLIPFAVTGTCYTLHMQLPLSEHLLTCLGGGLLFLLLAIVTKGAIGGGDIKLIAALGLWLGPRSLLTVIAYGFIAGGVAAIFLLISKQKKRNDYFAYGPYFALSGIGILLGWLKNLF